MQQNKSLLSDKISQWPYDLFLILPTSEIKKLQKTFKELLFK